MDLAVATVLLTATLPALACLALLVKLSSRGPALVAQTRVGRDGRQFRMFKLRTMVRGAHEMREDVIGTPDAFIHQRYRNDPRITVVGRMLRRWSLDELPQLAHVISGSMSLVGPRPILVEELPLLSPSDHRRHAIRPGITGLWQVSGRKTVDWDSRMRMDVAYVDMCSAALDARILARTITAVLRGDGAC